MPTDLDLEVVLLRERVAVMQKQVETLQVTLDNFEKSANRWRGGIAAMIALGGLLSGIITAGDKFLKMFGKS